VEACHKAHNVPTIPGPKEVKWIWDDTFEHAFANDPSPMLPHDVEKRHFFLLCNHCTNPSCVRVCPAGATYKTPGGLVAIDYHRCVGCRFCMAACPYGSRSFNFQDPRPFITDLNPAFPTRMRGVVEKCTFCAERLEKGLLPACVEASNGAIVFGDLNDPDSIVRRVLAKNFSLRRKPDLGTDPGVYYII
jgi:molybdopterin-containing oxidoreductase family iron-sulfur binding subunit